MLGNLQRWPPLTPGKHIPNGQSSGLDLIQQLFRFPTSSYLLPSPPSRDPQAEAVGPGVGAGERT